MARACDSSCVDQQNTCTQHDLPPRASASLAPHAITLASSSSHWQFCASALWAAAPFGGGVTRWGSKTGVHTLGHALSDARMHLRGAPAHCPAACHRSWPRGNSAWTRCSLICRRRSSPSRAASSAATSSAAMVEDRKASVTGMAADHQTVLVLDYGSQYTQLIARRIREFSMFSVMFPGDASLVRCGQRCKHACGAKAPGLGCTPAHNTCCGKRKPLSAPPLRCTLPHRSASRAWRHAPSCCLGVPIRCTLTARLVCPRGFSSGALLRTSACWASATACRCVCVTMTVCVFFR
jgi:hypothetical protein